MKQSIKLTATAVASVVAGLLVAAVALHVYRVQQLRAARAAVQIHLRLVEEQLTEVDLLNTGQGEAPLDRNVAVSWASGELIDAAALPGYDRVDAGPRSVIFRPRVGTEARRLAAGAEKAVGWVRLSDESTLSARFSDNP